jgi:Transglutaminase-like superfamily.
MLRTKSVRNLITGIAIAALTFVSLVPAMSVKAAEMTTTSVTPMAATASATAKATTKAATASTSATDELVTALENHETTIRLTSGSIKYTASNDNTDQVAAQVGNYLAAVLNDNPQLFYAKSSGVSFSMNRSNKTVATITPNYTMTASEAARATAKMDKAAKKIENKVSSNLTTKQKAKKVNDLLKANMTYKKNVSNCQTAYGALVQKRGVCQAYAMAYEYIMRDLGVKTTYQLNNDGSHIWNKVYSGGEWHHVDVTWNDTARTSQYFWTNSHEM